MKLTIRLVGYSLIAAWSIWLIGRPGEIDPDFVDTTAVLSDRQNGKAGAEEPPPLVEAERAKAVRLYIDRMMSTGQRVDQLMDYARQSPDDPAWSTPIRSAMNEVIRVTERELFESGALYVECGGLLCFIQGDLNIDTTLTQLPLALWAASNRDGARFATARSQESEQYGWVFFVAAPNFDIPPDL